LNLNAYTLKKREGMTNLTLLIVRTSHSMHACTRGDAESLKVKIYAEALANLTKQKEWRNLFQE